MHSNSKYHVGVHENLGQHFQSVKRVQLTRTDYNFQKHIYVDMNIYSAQSFILCRIFRVDFK